MGSRQGRSRRSTISEEQWANIKPRFIQLFCVQYQNKTLKQTMNILQKEGFVATVKMYKTQIRKGKIGKYNQDRAMRHVLRKARDFRAQSIRKSYRVQGRSVTIEDAKEHFKRKNIPVLDPTPNLRASPTPSILSIVSDGSAMTPGSEETLHDPPSSRFHSTIPKRTSNVKLFSVSYPLRATMRPPPRTPDTLRQTERLLRAVTVLCKDSMSHLRLRKGRYCMSTCHSLQTCLDAANAGMDFGRLKDSLEAYAKAQDLLHAMLQQRDPYIVVILCELVQCFLRYIHRGNRTVTPVSKSFLEYATQLATSVHSNHPLSYLPTLLVGDVKICRQLSNKLLQVMEHEMNYNHSHETRLDHISWYHRRYGMIYGGFQDEVEGMLLDELNLFDKWTALGCEAMEGQAAARLEIMALLLECYSTKKDYVRVLQWCQRILRIPQPTFMYQGDYQCRRWSVMCSSAWANAKLSRIRLAISQYEEAEQYAVENFGYGSYKALYSERLGSGFRSACSLREQESFSSYNNGDPQAVMFTSS